MRAQSVPTVRSVQSYYQSRPQSRSASPSGRTSRAESPVYGWETEIRGLTATHSDAQAKKNVARFLSQSQFQPERSDSREPEYRRVHLSREAARNFQPWHRPVPKPTKELETLHSHLTDRDQKKLARTVREVAKDPQILRQNPKALNALVGLMAIDKDAVRRVFDEQGPDFRNRLEVLKLIAKRGHNTILATAVLLNYNANEKREILRAFGAELKREAKKHLWLQVVLGRLGALRKDEPPAKRLPVFDKQGQSAALHRPVAVTPIKISLAASHQPSAFKSPTTLRRDLHSERERRQKAEAALAKTNNKLEVLWQASLIQNENVDALVRGLVQVLPAENLSRLSRSLTTPARRTLGLDRAE